MIILSPYEALGALDNALKYYLKSIEISRRLYGELHPDIASSFNKIGPVYNSLGDSKKVLEYFLMSVNIRKRLYSEHHPDVAQSLRYNKSYI